MKTRRKQKKGDVQSRQKLRGKSVCGIFLPCPLHCTTPHRTRVDINSALWNFQYNGSVSIYVNARHGLEMRSDRLVGAMKNTSNVKLKAFYAEHEEQLEIFEQSHTMGRIAIEIFLQGSA